MNHLLTLLTALGGFVAVCFSMQRHQEHLLGRQLPVGRSRALRLGGWLLLGVAYAIAVRAFGWGIGSVAWTGHLAAAAAIVLLTLVWHDRRTGDARAAHGARVQAR
jgi:membrane associated rhomboid family serine protease